MSEMVKNGLFGADLQNAKNIQKPTEILAMWKLMNSRTISLMKKKGQKRKKKNDNNKYTGNDTILKIRKYCYFQLFESVNKLVLGNLRLCKKEYPEHIICIKRGK